MQKLTIAEVKKSKPSDKQKKLSNGGGLYLLIKPNGARYWRYDYRYIGTRKTLALGSRSYRDRACATITTLSPSRYCVQCISCGSVRLAFMRLSNLAYCRLTARLIRFGMSTPPLRISF